MNQKSPENTDITENATDEHVETSRRGLLAAGAAAVVGVTTTMAASREARAQGPGPGVWSFYGSDLVRMPDASYLGDPKVVSGLALILDDVWNEMGATPPYNTTGVIYTALFSGNYATVRDKMAELIPGAADKISVEKPVVITTDEYNNGYIKRDSEEIIFVLPKPPGTANSNGKTGGSVRTVMAAVPFGM